MGMGRKSAYWRTVSISAFSWSRNDAAGLRRSSTVVPISSRQPVAQLSRVAAADGGKLVGDLVGGQPVAVVGDNEDAPLRVDTEVDARLVVRLGALNPPADARVVGVLDQLAHADLLARIEVL